MKLSLAFAALAGAQLAAAHAFVYAIHINGKDMGRGDGKAGPGYIRPGNANSPIKDVKSSAMTCNTPGTPAARYIDVKGGDKITVEWHHEKRGNGDIVLASSHKGPVQVYIAPASSNGKGNVWVKIASEGYNEGSKQWATDKLRTNGGKHQFVMPPVAPGQYLIRPEIVALHEGQKSGGAQLYMACIQMKVTGGGSAKLPSGIAIPGGYGSEGIIYDVYSKPLKKYTPPGGPVKRIAA